MYSEEKINKELKELLLSSSRRALYPLLLFLPRLRLTSAHGKMREVVKASGHQRARKDWELTAAAEIWLQMLLEIGS